MRNHKNFLSYGTTDFGRKKQYKKATKKVYISAKMCFL